MSSANMKYSNKIKMEADPVKSEVDFSEYMWMGEEGVENFDRQVEKEILEEILKEGHWWLFSAGSQLKSELNADQLPSLPITEEQLEWNRLQEAYEEMLNEKQQSSLLSNSCLTERFNDIHLSTPLTKEQIANSRLNPNAPEFIPSTGF
ncbi:uncharacterized protein LOC106870754 isoform X1 [Octopus bimaculoides]|uniref:Uncharacterized protein n=2 Tax=Octopus bimaculoides TaxID=37653 RepID=A0A0L8HGU6_OCTBM|nr:uncharacterized protein LOC106870754 isoform X1 [Octopus bimaculoides]|eukprot:XP_014772436.1 PREDICTED: uncharacterized protein LOC106870754 [Octopus bimaculoides]